MNTNNLILNMSSSRTDQTRDVGNSRKPASSTGKSKSFKDAMAEAADSANSQNDSPNAGASVNPEPQVQDGQNAHPEQGIALGGAVESALGGLTGSVKLQLGTVMQSSTTVQNSTMMAASQQQGPAVLQNTAPQVMTDLSQAQAVQTGQQSAVQTGKVPVNDAALMNGQANLNSADGKKAEDSAARNQQQLQTQTAKPGQEVKAVEVKSESYGLQEEGKGEEKQTSTNLSGNELPKAKVAEEGTIFVKVSQSQTVAQPEKLAADLGEKIVYNAANGKQEFDIELSPADLGKINIKLVFEGGKATVLLNCSNPQTQQTLMANAEQLRHIVESGTGRFTEVAAHDNPGNMGHQNPDQRGENEARDEQKERMAQEHQLDRNQVSMFVERFRLGLTQAGQAV